MHPSEINSYVSYVPCEVTQPLPLSVWTANRGNTVTYSAAITALEKGISKFKGPRVLGQDLTGQCTDILSMLGVYVSSIFMGWVKYFLFGHVGFLGENPL